MKKDALTKALAIAGTVLLWFPIVATLGLSLFGSIRSGMFRFDWLIPAELFTVVLVGGALLLWAAIRAHARRGLVGWGIGVAVGLLLGGQLVAEVTGLASGDIEPTSWAAAAVAAAVVVYSAAVVELGVTGVLLVRDLFRRAKEPQTPAMPSA